MRRTKLVTISLLFGLILSISSLAQAEHYDLFSRKVGNDWEFSVLPGLNNTSKAAVEIRSQAVRGIGQVKSKILAMKEGDSILWQVRPESDMLYPPDATMTDLQEYATSLGIKLDKLPKKP